MISLITAIYDSYDPLREFPIPAVGYEAICITDNPDLASETWDVRYEPRPGVHPNRAAKRPKCCPWEYTDCEVVVWLDASFRILTYEFLPAMLDYLPIGQFLHPDRDCIYTEGEYSAGLGKYANEPLADQMDDYRQRGHPQNWGLWATGLIARRRTPEVEAFGKAWLAENERWSFQDQVSEAVMLREHDLRPVTIPGAYHMNPWVQYNGSSRH